MRNARWSLAAFSSAAVVFAVASSLVGLALERVDRRKFARVLLGEDVTS